MSKFIGKKVIVRSNRAGVFFGMLVSESNNNVLMQNVRKIYYWDGACAVEQIANDGVGTGSKITVVVEEMEISEAIQIIPCTDKSVKNIESCPVWKK